MDAQIKKGFIEFCVLLIISKGRVYTSDILETMRQAELILVEGTLYPLLSRLRKEQLVTYDLVESAAGPARKYYSLTTKGHQKLNEYKQTWHQLNKSINFLLQQYD